MPLFAGRRPTPSGTARPEKQLGQMPKGNSDEPESEHEPDDVLPLHEVRRIAQHGWPLPEVYAVSAPNSQNAELATTIEQFVKNRRAPGTSLQLAIAFSEDKWAQIVAALRAQQDGPSGAWRCPTCSATCIPHRAKPEAGADDARDAARYRWLRARGFAIYEPGGMVTKFTGAVGDAAIDMAAQQDATSSPEGEKHG